MNAFKDFNTARADFANAIDDDAAEKALDRQHEAADSVFADIAVPMPLKLQVALSNSDGMDLTGLQAMLSKIIDSNNQLGEFVAMITEQGE
jgi:hypothetical protein